MSEDKANGVNGSGATVTPIRKRTKRNGIPAAESSGVATIEVEAKPEPIPPPVPPVEAAPATTPAPAPAPAYVEAPWFERIPQSDIAVGLDPKEGWQEGSSALLYTSEANGYQAIRVLCTDVRLWGGVSEAIMCRSKTAVRVRLSDGDIYETPPGITFAILAVDTLMEIAQKLQADPECVIEAVIAPIGKRRTEDGRIVITYRHVSRVIPNLKRQDAWRS